MPFERWQYAWRVRLRMLLDRDRVDRELDDELRHHVALETEARRARGAPPAEARRQALASLGGLESARNHVREARFGAALEHVLQDVRYVLRVLRRNPGFTATTVLTLTLAISATTATFSVVDAVLLQPPPFPEPDRLVTLWETDPENGNRPTEPAPANFLDWREQATSFERVAALEPWSVDLTGADTPEVLYGWLVTKGFFETLGAGAAHGRTFLPDEYRPGSGVVILTDGVWRRRFDGDPGMVGRTLVLDDEPYTVVGVLAPSFELSLEGGRNDRDLLLPKAIARVRELHSRRRLVAGDRADPPRRHPRRGPGRDGRHRGPARRRLPAHQRRRRGARHPPADASGRGGAAGAAAPLGRRRLRPPDRLRQTSRT